MISNRADSVVICTYTHPWMTMRYGRKEAVKSCHWQDFRRNWWNGLKWLSHTDHSSGSIGQLWRIPGLFGLGPACWRPWPSYRRVIQHERSTCSFSLTPFIRLYQVRFLGKITVMSSIDHTTTLKNFSAKAWLVLWHASRLSVQYRD